MFSVYESIFTMKKANYDTTKSESKVYSTNVPLLSEIGW